MFPTINAAYNAAKKSDFDHQLILESILDVDETIPGSEEELDDIVDSDSVPADVYAKIDKELDKIVSSPDYDDTEVEEMMDDDFDVDDISDAEIDAIIDEAFASHEVFLKAAEIVANLNEKAGNNDMANNVGMGLLRTLSESSVNQFKNGKMDDPIGQAYEPVETPKASEDETELENDALRENAVDRYRKLLEGSTLNDIQQFDTYVSKTNPNVAVNLRKTPGSAIAGAAADVALGAATGAIGSKLKSKKAINKLKKSGASEEEIAKAKAESNNRAKKAALKGAAIGGGAGAAMQAADSLSGGKLSDKLMSIAGYRRLGEGTDNPDVEDFPGAEGTSTSDGSFPKGLPEPNGCACSSDNIGGDDNVADAEAREVGVEDGGTDAIDVTKANEAANHYRSYLESVTNPDVEDFPSQTGAGNEHGEKEGALPEGEEPADFPNKTGTKTVNSGDDPTTRYKAVAEAINIDAIRSATKTTANTAKNAFKNATDDQRMYAASGSGAVAGATLGAALGKHSRGVRKAEKEFQDAWNSNNLNAAIAAKQKLEKAKKRGKIAGAVAGGILGAAGGGTLADEYNYAARQAQRAVRHETANPDVEDFPGSEGTHTDNGDYPKGLNEPDGCSYASHIGGYDNTVDVEARQIKVEDGGDDAIAVIQANEDASDVVLAGLNGASAGSGIGATAAYLSSKKVREAKANLKAAKAAAKTAEDKKQAAEQVDLAKMKLMKAQKSAMVKGALAGGAAGGAIGTGAGAVFNNYLKNHQQ